ncbi:expressed unknown protein [Seminavis robusta]|uniref:Uncharacterized protein n=1 Tax=Seminavis robusta TaxID=568900 RepID=A0A9N8DNW4_9STRA|nr:expressed unknown protein [Seminavis robusta]|eukprot:Sro159_g071920.1 n/a (268) ;mRNA; r:80164-81205
MKFVAVMVMVPAPWVSQRTFPIQQAKLRFGTREEKSEKTKTRRTQQAGTMDGNWTTVLPRKSKKKGNKGNSANAAEGTVMVPLGQLSANTISPADGGFPLGAATNEVAATENSTSNKGTATKGYKATAATAINKEDTTSVANKEVTQRSIAGAPTPEHGRSNGTNNHVASNNDIKHTVNWYDYTLKKAKETFEKKQRGGVPCDDNLGVDEFESADALSKGNGYCKDDSQFAEMTAPRSNESIPTTNIADHYKAVNNLRCSKQARMQN